MSQIRAFLFDQDGVIVDTERDGHRVAFNRTFTEFGFDVEWGVDEYHDLLQIGGGKERMTHYLQTKGFGVAVKSEGVPELIGRLHRRKTDIFIELLESRSLPLRPGVRRLMEEAAGLGLILGVCTTSNECAARAIATVGWQVSRCSLCWRATWCGSRNPTGYLPAGVGEVRAASGPVRGVRGLAHRRGRCQGRRHARGGDHESVHRERGPEHG